MAITVTALHVTPVKGMRIRSVPSVTLGADGARGDRAFYVVGTDGAMVNAKRVGNLQAVVADHDPDAGTLLLRFPDGTTAGAQVALGTEIDTSFFSRPRRARLLDGPWAAALSAFAGQPRRIVAGGSASDRGDAGAVSLVSRGSLERLARTDGGGGAPVDARRFRMLIEVDGAAPHDEDRWVGRELAIGDARLELTGHVGRCVTTTRNAETGEVDLPTLKMLGEYRRDLPDVTEPLPFGVHGAVLVGGEVRVGDAVRLVDRDRGGDETVAAEPATGVT